MLKIINDLTVFFDDCYRRVHVREYAQLKRISPPTASKLLSAYEKEALLKKEIDKNYFFYSANRDNSNFISLSRMYWKIKLNHLLVQVEKEIFNPVIILFGSLAKGEAKNNSDVDLVIIGHKRKIITRQTEREIKRHIQLFWFKSIKDIKNKELANNILNGFVLRGKIKL